MDKILKEINDVQEGLGVKYLENKKKRAKMKTTIARYTAKHGRPPKNLADVLMFMAQELARKRKRKPAVDRRTADRRKKADRQEEENKMLLEKLRQQPKDAITLPAGTPAATPAAITNPLVRAMNGSIADRINAGQQLSSSMAVIPYSSDKKESKGKEVKIEPTEIELGDQKLKFDYNDPESLLKESHRTRDILNNHRNRLLKEKAELKTENEKLTASKKKVRENELKSRFTEDDHKKWNKKNLEEKINYLAYTHPLELKLPAKPPKEVKSVDDLKKVSNVRALSREQLEDMYKQTNDYKEWKEKHIEYLNRVLDMDGYGADIGPMDADVTSNIQLGEWMKDVPGFQYVLSRNQPLKFTKPANKLGQRSWIMNLSPLGERGTHWVSILQSPTSLEYFNSLGDDVPRDIVANMLRLPGASTAKFKENALQTQSKTTSNCGYHACKFIIDRLTMGFPEATGFSDAEKDASVKGEEALKEWREQFPAFKIIGGFAASGPSNALTNQLDNREVLNVTVERAPIHAALEVFLKLISLGRISQAMRKAQYDKLFHLSVVLELEDGSRLRLEKNETVQMSRYTQKPDTEVMPAGNPSCTLQEFVQRGADFQGASFWTWEVQNNCQVFVNSLLEGNHLMTPALKAFVLQDVKGIMKSSPPWLEGMMNGVTKVAARLRNIFDRIFA